MRIHYSLIEPVSNIFDLYFAYPVTTNKAPISKKMAILGLLGGKGVWMGGECSGETIWGSRAVRSSWVVLGGKSEVRGDRL